MSDMFPYCLIDESPMESYPDAVSHINETINGLRVRVDSRVPVGEVWVIDPSTDEKIAEIINIELPRPPNGAKTGESI